MTLEQVQAFLVLTEELHFGRSAGRLHLSQPRVSRLVRSLETEIGGTLFARTSRQVRITPLGIRLRDHLGPAYAQLLAAIDDSRAAARGTDGLLTVGVTDMSGGPALDHLIEVFRARHPDCEVTVTEVSMWDPYGPLRGNEVDVLCNWLVVDEPDLTVGPAIDYRDRVLAVGMGHRLAKRGSVSIEDIANEQVNQVPESYPAALRDAILPLRTPSGKPIRRRQAGPTMQERLSLIARGQFVHPTMTSLSVFARDDIVLVPIRDLPDMPLGLIWCCAHENARIRAFAEVARSLKPQIGRPLP
jgi:DNA-binding transcriptional LysR family regulator